MLWSGASLGSAVMVTVYGSAATVTGAGKDPLRGMEAAFATGAIFAACAFLLAVLVLRVRRE